MVKIALNAKEGYREK